MRTAFLISLAALALAAATPSAMAQRGVGDEEGIVRSGVPVEPATIAGTVTDIVQGPCEQTTGRALVGVHLMVEGADGQPINLHLGPLAAMDEVLAAVKVGDTVTTDAFRTAALPEGAYIARTVTVGDQTFTLRGTDLRPVWAGSWRQGFGPRMGMGPGGRRGPGWNQRGQGQGWGQGQGLGQGQGSGMGFGIGPGARGQGWGQGQGSGTGPGLGLGPCQW